MSLLSVTTPQCAAIKFLALLSAQGISPELMNDER